MLATKLSSHDIVNRFDSELSAIAADCGIDWHKAKDHLRLDGVPVKRGIELNKDYRGKVFMVAYEWVAPDGNAYPTITFKTFRHGGHQETWNGFKAWRDLSENVYIPQAYRPKKANPVLSDNERETRYKINRFSDFKKTFNQLPKVAVTGEIGGYLTRKGFSLSDLPESFDLRRGEDNRGAFIAYPLQDFQHSTVGYQKIYDAPFIGSDGKPRDKDFVFYPDSKNGSHAWLGIPPKNTDEAVYLGEGLATCLTVHLATGKPVAVCLDAQNMRNVHAGLVKTRSNLCLASDNDVKDDGGNTGIFCALQAARFSDSKIAYPELDGQKCDFNDLHLARGIDEVRAQLQTNVLDAPKNPLDYYKLLATYAPKQQLPKVLSSACFFAAKIIITAQDLRHHAKAISALRKSPLKDIVKQLKKYIKARVALIRHHNTPTDLTDITRHSFDDLRDNQQIADEIISLGGIWLDYRGMGMGKTKLMAIIAKLKDHNSRIAYIAHRVSLTKTASQGLELHHYQDGNSDIENMAVCVDSIIRRDLLGVNVLFIDEARQVLEHVLNGKTVKNRLEVYNKLVALIQAADLVIFADADLNQFAVDWIKSIANKPIHAIDSQPTPTGKTIHALASGGDAIYQARQAIMDGQNVWIATDSITQATKAKIALSELLDDSEVLFLTKKNKGDERQAAFLLNPNEESAKYRAIIHTPVISSGVSIEHGHFHAVYALFCNVIPPNEMLQTIARVRKAKNIYISFKANHTKNRLVNEQVLIEGEITNRGLFYKDTGCLQLIDLDRLRLKHIATLNQTLNDYKAYFLILAQIKGYSVNQVMTESPVIKGLSTAAKAYSQAEVLSGETIEDDTAKLIGNKPNPTQAESNALDKYNTAQITGKTPDTVNEVDVAFYLNGGGKVIANHELIKADIRDLQERDCKNHITRDKLESQTSKHLFFSLVVGLKDKQIDREMAGRIDGWLCENYKTLGINGMGNYSKPSTRPLKRLSNFLKLCGYELVLYKQRANGERVYEIKENQQVFEYVKNRSHKRGLFA
jgi:putative DNA primase/helicase